MSPFELPEEAEELLRKIDQVEYRAEAAEKEIRDRAQAAEKAFNRERAAIAQDREILDALIEERTAAYELVARVWRDYEIARADADARELEHKTRPAPKAAEQVRKKGSELAAVRREQKLASYIVELYEWHFPWLVDFRDEQEAEAFVAREATPEEVGDTAADPVSGWLTPEEFQALPSVERNQRALDRYLKSRKSPWHLGRDYERYIGYLREQAGCEVTYHGIFQGLEDLGRDVLAVKDGQMEIIQCKRWAQRKTIHEKHVFQLYGTVVLARLENPELEVSGTFTTTTSLSEKAREVADYLEIKVEESVPLDDYPRIKCNVTRRDGERVYHLPIDQQYDRTLIEPERGEMYVTTVAEAEAAGFRRAWRWHGEQAN